MKTIDAIKNFGKKALVGGLILSGWVIGCGSGERGDKTIVNQKLDNNYSVKVIANVKPMETDSYQFILTDSSGNNKLNMDNIPGSTRISLKQNDDYTMNIYNGEINYTKTEKNSTK